MRLLIYTDQSNSRIIYTFEFVFRYVLGLEINFISDKKVFIRAEDRKLNYSSSLLDCKCLQIIPSSFLHQKGIIPLEALDSFKQHLPSESPKNADPFSLIFFMISRYEEYHNPLKDSHGRFSATASFAFKNNVLELPIVDIWIHWLKDQLNALFPTFKTIASPSYQYIPTYDIDHVRAYLWKGGLRTTGGIVKDIIRFQGKDLIQRIKTLTGIEQDIYDQFDYFDQIHRKYKLSSIYFWLLGDLGEFDKNSDYRNESFRAVIEDVASKYEIGIHPSYQSFLNPKQIKEEIRRLAEISHLSIKKNRFHFLRFQLPQSFRTLLELGIKDDYSMAYADAIGFRAGTSHPFYWYDLENESITDLKIHPFQIMDVSLKNYLGLSKEEAIERANQLISCIKKYGGCFISLWHNSSFDENEWDGWKTVYEEIVFLAQEGTIPNS